jgi:hypothetical protein
MSNLSTPPLIVKAYYRKKLDYPFKTKKMKVHNWYEILIDIEMATLKVHNSYGEIIGYHDTLAFFMEHFIFTPQTLEEIKQHFCDTEDIEEVLGGV